MLLYVIILEYSSEERVYGATCLKPKIVTRTQVDFYDIAMNHKCTPVIRIP